MVMRPSKMVMRPSKMVMRPSKMVMRPSKMVMRPSKMVMRSSKTVMRPTKTKNTTQRTQREKNTSAFPAEAKSKPRQTGLRKQVMQMEDVVGTIDTYLENNPLKDRESVINAVVLTFRQYLDHINASEGKLADKGYVR